MFIDLGSGKRRVLIRGNIDALPISSELSTDYQSQVTGVMHACGHDAHAAMTWGALAIFKALAEAKYLTSDVAIRAVFQPAEETSTGGLHMIEAGATDGIDSAIALHVDPSRSVGTVGVRYGSFTAGCDSFIVEFQGQPGHSARPHLTGDTIAVAVSWVSEVYQRVSRCSDPREPLVVNVGRFHSGTAENVVPSSASLAGTLRSTSLAGREIGKHTMRRVTEAIQQAYDVRVSLEFPRHTLSLINDSIVSESLRIAACEQVGRTNVQLIDQPSMGAEDFAFIAEQVPSAMFRLGIAGPTIGSSPLHTPTFDIDEEALPIGAAILTSAAIRLSLQETPSPSFQ